MSSKDFQPTSNQPMMLRVLAVAIIAPVVMLVLYSAILRLFGPGSLGPIGDLTVYIIVASLGFAYLSRALGRISIVWVFLYFPVVFAVTFAVSFILLGLTGGMEL